MKTSPASRSRPALLSIALLLAGLACAHAATPEFAIRNAQRPGGAAASCPAAGPTPDGCTFHTLAGDVNRVRLPVVPGHVWTVATPDAALVEIRQGVEDSGAAGDRFQVIEIVPTRPEDADIVLTFDRLTVAPGPIKLVERRRVSMMKHSDKSWHEH